MAGLTTTEATADEYRKLLKPTKADYTPEQLESRLNLLRRVSPAPPDSEAGDESADRS